MEEKSRSTPEVVACSVVSSLDEILYEMILDEPLRMHCLNGAVETLTGYCADELMAQTPDWIDIVHPEDKPRYAESLRRCRQAGHQHKLQYRVCAKDGSTCDVLDRAVAVTDASGQIIGIHGLLVNVTEQVRSRRELERSQMLQSIGKLSAGIAHEINTPIQFLGDNMRFLDDGFRQIMELIDVYAALRQRAADGPAAPDAVEAVAAKERQIDFDFLREEIPQAIKQNLEGVKLVSAIVAAMRDFSHIDERRKAPADLNKALNSTIIILRNTLKYTADVEKDFDPNLPEVLCCVDDLNQVFLNLLVNASHSIEEAIEAGRYKRGLIRVRTQRDDDHVVISISDNGTGIPEAIREKIFERFFTTKSKDRKGTGQGLATVLDIVRDKHNGTISLDSEVGEGTTFTLRLPVDTGEKRQP
ncbi:MAG: PAS domain-containing protein [Phycisphaerae bacterium]|nr:PAS domain-containing protein [Phycisphaerae bacterium]